MNRVVHRGIAGVDGREPIGAALSVGRKGERGNPIDTDRFFLVVPREGDDKRRPLHPMYSGFNHAQDPTRQQFVRGNLVHITEEDAFEWHLKAMVKPGGKMHPDRRPWCTGDGEQANRWMGGPANNFKTIVCPNERCEYRVSDGGAPPACRPWMRFLFRLRAPVDSKMPATTVKYTSMGWETTTGFVGFFKALRRAQEQLHAEDLPLYGYPITITVNKRTKPSRGQRYPVVDIAGEIDPVEFFVGQRERLETIRREVPVAALTSDVEQAPETIAADYRLIKPRAQAIGAAPEAVLLAVDEKVPEEKAPPVDDRIPGWD